MDRPIRLSRPIRTILHRSAAAYPAEGGDVGQLRAPLLGPCDFVGLEAVLLVDQEALRLLDDPPAMFVQTLGDAPRGPAGQRGRPVGAGVEGGRLAADPAEAVEPLPEPQAGRIRVEDKGRRLVELVDRGLAGAGPAHAVDVRRSPDHHQIGLGRRVKAGPVDWDDGDLGTAGQPSTDGVGHRVGVAVHGLVHDKRSHPSSSSRRSP